MEKTKVLHIVGALNLGGAETMIMNIFRISIVPDFNLISTFPVILAVSMKKKSCSWVDEFSMWDGGRSTQLIIAQNCLN